MHENESKIVIYQTADGETAIDVKMENDTVWLSQSQMAELFQKDRTVIGRHIKNIFEEGELERTMVCANFAHTTRHGAINGKTQVQNQILYNLDVIISVGYRVKSVRGTQFRIWANKILKDYLVKGYAINSQVAAQKYEELCKLVALVGRTAKTQEQISGDEAKSLVAVVSDYARALDTLDDYDYQRLAMKKVTRRTKFRATYENAMEAILAIKKKFGESELFAHEKDESFKSSIGQIYQTFDGEELYPSVEEKAATLLYLVIKNHSFSDGNKRIADNTLVAITLMIAESRPQEKDMMVKVVVNLINKDN